MFSNFFTTFGLSLLLSLAFVGGHAQSTNTTETDTARIALLARAYGDSIVLRWGPSTPTAWQQLNKIGYRVERHTILRDGRLLAVPERRTLLPDPIRPRPLPDWESVAERDQYAAILAQALYGETFDVSSSNRSDIVQMINQAREQEQRFSFALFSADISATAARYAGLRLTDRDIRANEKYLYKVFAAGPKAMALDTGLVFLAGSDRTELPAPVQVSATFDDRRVMLRWNKYYHESTYVAYQVERSTDGTSFVPITDLPVIFTRSSGQADRYMFKGDSLPDNETTYHYRVRGFTPFGEIGPPSEVVSGQGYRALQTPPAIVKAEVNASGTAAIAWDIDEASAPLVQHFSVEKAPAVDGPYRAVAQSLPRDARSLADPRVEGTNYYRVSGHGRRDEVAHSFPVLVQAEDSIPPTTPEEITGQIDTTGRVTLRWPASPESDVLGYRIFRSNHADRDFVQITREPTPDTTWVDQISLKNLTKFIYYKVSAVDRRFNPSSLSEAVALRKPDIIPLMAPVVKAVRPRADGVWLSWMGSPSEDVTHYLIYRRLPRATSWQLIGPAPDTARHFLDQTVAPSQPYEYILLAVDTSQLESVPTPPQTVTSGAALRAKVAHTYAEADREGGRILVRWDYPNDEVREYHIYRAEADAALRWHDTVAAPQLQLSDEAVNPSQTYRYRIKAVYTDGTQSPLSEVVRVLF